MWNAEEWSSTSGGTDGSTLPLRWCGHAVLLSDSGLRRRRFLCCLSWAWCWKQRWDFLDSHWPAAVLTAHPCPQDTLALPKLGSPRGASSSICLVVWNDLLVKRWGKLVFRIRFDLHYQSENKMFISPWFNVLLIVCTLPFLIHWFRWPQCACWVREPCWISPSEKPKRLRICYPPLLKALAFDLDRFHFIPWTGYFQAT